MLNVSPNQDNFMSSAAPAYQASALASREKAPSEVSGGDENVYATPEVDSGSRGQIVPAEELLEELTAALRSARDMAPHMASLDLDGVVKRILDEWIERVQCSEMLGPAGAEAMVGALRELKNAAMAGDPLAVYENFSAVLRRSEVLSRPVYLCERKRKNKFELLGLL